MVGASRLDHLRTVGVLVNHRLLAVNILPCLHGIHRDLLVPVIGCADDHRVHIFSCQDFLVVARGKHVVAPQFLAVLEAPVIAVRDRDQLHAWNLQRRARVAHSLPTRTDERDLNMIVSGNRSSRLLLRCCQRIDLRS